MRISDWSSDVCSSDLAFLHAATQRVALQGRMQHVNRHVYAFGTDLTDLSNAFRLSDTDAMLTRAGTLIDDFAGGTRLATSLRTLRRLHARQLVGRRTVVRSEERSVGKEGVRTGRCRLWPYGEK